MAQRAKLTPQQSEFLAFAGHKDNQQQFIDNLSEDNYQSFLRDAAAANPVASTPSSVPESTAPAVESPVVIRSPKTNAADKRAMEGQVRLEQSKVAEDKRKPRLIEIMSGREVLVNDELTHVGERKKIVAIQSPVESHTETGLVKLRDFKGAENWHTPLSLNLKMVL